MPCESNNPILECPQFLMQHGRLPRIGDDPPPWKYRGWLLPYVQMLDMQSEKSRWSYQMRMLEAGKLLDEPIPQIIFADLPDKSVFRLIEKWCALIGHDMGGWLDFRAFIDWLLWALALSRTEPDVRHEDANEQLYRAVDMGVFLKTPHDYFGSVISERMASGWNPKAFYPTPHSVCEAMARMTFPEGEDCRSKTVCDPALGTGRLLLHASNFSLRLYGMDIDPLVLACAKINGALYAPWLAFALPENLFPAESIHTPAAAPSPPPELIAGESNLVVSDTAEALPMPQQLVLF